MKLRPRYFYLLLCSVLFAACGTKKMLQAPTHEQTSQIAKEKNKELSIALPQNESVDANVTYTLHRNGKKDKQVKGTLQILRGKGILIRVAPFLGITVAEMYIQPSGITVIDHLNSRYLQTDFQELSNRLYTRLNYQSVEALFLNALFLSDKYPVENGDKKRFGIKQEGNTTVLTDDSHQQAISKFYIENHKLQKTELSVKTTAHKLLWNYAQFSIEGYPQQIRIDLSEKTPMGGLSINLRKAGFNRLKHIDFVTPDNSYDRVSMTDVLKMISSL